MFAHTPRTAPEPASTRGTPGRYRANSATDTPRLCDAHPLGSRDSILMCLGIRTIVRAGSVTEPSSKRRRLADLFLRSYREQTCSREKSCHPVLALGQSEIAMRGFLLNGQS